MEINKIIDEAIKLIDDYPCLSYLEAIERAKEVFNYETNTSV